MFAHPVLRLLALCVLVLLPGLPAQAAEKRLAYLVSDARIPFWDILRRGVAARAGTLGYTLESYSADNSAKTELENMARAIRSKVDGIVLSPTNSSAAVTLLKLAKDAGIPVVIADIGTEGGDYVSYIASDNHEGSYQLGQLLVEALGARGWKSGSVGIIAIPQKRANGRARTAGFMKALEAGGIKGGGLRQQVDFSHKETYDFARELLAADPAMRALWLQGSERYQAALDAIRDAGRAGQVLLLSFDAEPEFLEMIPKGTLAAAGMQQPFLMGEEAVSALDAHLKGRAVPREQKLPVLAISTENIAQKLPLIRRNVLGQGAK